MDRRIRESWILKISCPDRLGIVASVAGALRDSRCNIVESAQFGDQESGRFFMRVAVDADASDAPLFLQRLHELTPAFDLDFEFFPATQRPRTLVMVSREGHCLHHLLSRRALGELPFDITAVVSNHETFRAAAEAQGVPFFHVPVTPEGKEQAERQLRALIDEHAIDLIALARYMQILSPAFCRDYEHRLVNIHHSFLPSFKGARPYHQAHAHGVKLVGATAHFVTAELDEGPIIEQETIRIDHGTSAAEIVRHGRDIECLTLARALTWIAQGRVLINGRKTVVL